MVFRRVLPLILPIIMTGCIFAPGNAVAAQKPTKKTKSTGASKGHTGRVQTGLEILEAEKFALLRGKRVGLISNHTGQDMQGRSTVELLAHAPGVQLVALFSPEHGIAGHSDEKVSSSKDASTGLPVYSLYLSLIHI